MSALVTNETIEQGADFQREFTVTNLDGSDIPNFASFDFECFLRDRFDNFVLEVPIQVTSSKTILFWLTNTQASALNNFKRDFYKSDIEALSPSGLKYRLVQMTFTVSKEQTKPEPV